MTIKAVIFDWGGVMEALPDEATFAAWAPRFSFTPERFLEVLWGSVWEQVETGDLSVAEYEAHLSRECGFNGREAIDSFYKDFYDTGLHHDMLKAAARLRADYSTALLTNAWPGQEEHIARQTGSHPADLFDHYINSATVRLRKPMPEIFHLTLDRLGVAPAEALFIDDNALNIIAAQSIGIQAIKFESQEQALGEMSEVLSFEF